MPYLGNFAMEPENNIVIFEVSTLESITDMPKFRNKNVQI